MALDQLSVDGRRFSLVCVRRTGVAVYRGDGTYLRLGDGVAGELATHQRMSNDGYPVAQILEVGTLDGSLYFIETSLGKDTYGDAWADRIAQGGSVTGADFARFREILRRHAHAQLASSSRDHDRPGLAAFIGVEAATANSPELARTIEAAWERALSVLGGLPTALQHGDLHPFNTCAGGIIDLEGAGWAPVGYDAITAVLEPTLAEPRWSDDALVTRWFTRNQVLSHLQGLDGEFQRFGLPALSACLHAFLACRAISLGAHVHRNPSIWKSRRLMLARVLPEFVDSGRLPLAVEA